MKQTRKASPRTLLILWTLGFIAILAPYITTLHHPFIYDDYGQILDNPFLRTPANLLHTLGLNTFSADEIINGRRPLIIVSYIIDLGLWGDQPEGFRVTNLLAHVCVMLLCGWMVFRLTGHKILAASTILLFGAHPVIIEAVHIPSFRDDIFLLPVCVKGVSAVILMFLIMPSTPLTFSIFVMALYTLGRDPMFNSWMIQS